MKSLAIEVNVPALDPVRQAGARRAYADAIAREIDEAAQELAGYHVRHLVVHGATRLDDRGLSHVFAALRRALGGQKEPAFKVAEVEPALLSTGLMTPLRNFGIDRYDVDLGSLNAAEFHALKRPYELGTYDLTRTLFEAYGLTSWRAKIAIGTAGQTAATCADCLNKLVSWGPAEVQLGILPNTAVCGDALPPLARKDDDIERICARLEQADEMLRAAGYRRAKPLLYTRIGGSGTIEASMTPQTERWGFGLGAISLMDDCLVRNTSDLARYLSYLSGQGDSDSEENGTGVIEQAVRLDASSLARMRTWEALISADGLAVPDDTKGTPGTESSAELDNSHARTLENMFAGLVQRGLARRGADGKLALTTRGLACADCIRSELDTL